MTSPLKLSHNELSALLKSVFQACFGHSQDWAAMAHTVLWLEAHGFGGAAMLMNAFDENLQSASFAGKVEETSAGYAVDFNEGHGVLAVHMIADLAIEAALRTGMGVVEVRAAVGPAALIAALPHCARHGFSAQLIGPNLNAQIQPYDAFPSLYEGNYAGVRLICKKECPEPETMCLKPNRQLQTHYHETLLNGLAIDPDIYSVLTQVSDRMLVEDSEASRKGAGE